jgi:hypothetical protein
VFAEVAAVGAVPFVVLLDQDVPCEAEQRSRVGERTDVQTSVNTAPKRATVPL